MEEANVLYHEDFGRKTFFSLICHGGNKMFTYSIRSIIHKPFTKEKGEELKISRKG